jgi:phage shock protein E
MIPTRTLLLSATLAGLTSLATAVADESSKQAAEQGWQYIQAGALLVDVRSGEEFAGGHIEGAINIPFDQVDALVEALGPDHDREVVLYCGSGRRAGIAADALRERGYTGVYNATGYGELQATQP